MRKKITRKNIFYIILVILVICLAIALIHTIIEDSKKHWRRKDAFKNQVLNEIETLCNEHFPNTSLTSIDNTNLEILTIKVSYVEFFQSDPKYLIYDVSITIPAVEVTKPWTAKATIYSVTEGIALYIELEIEEEK